MCVALNQQWTITFRLDHPSNLLRFVLSDLVNAAVDRSFVSNLLEGADSVRVGDE